MKIHGMSKTKLYRVWDSMKARCQRKTHKQYKNYGGRGITVCKEWQNFIPFRDWALKSGYKDGLEIDRKNNNGNYTPTNCRWVTRKENTNNRRITKIIEYNGKFWTASEFSSHFNLSINIIHSRLKLGWTVEQILASKTPYKGKLFTLDGRTLNITEWAKEVNISQRSMCERIDANEGVFDKSCLRPKGQSKEEYSLSA